MMKYFCTLFLLLASFECSLAASLPLHRSNTIKEIGISEMDDYCLNACSLGCAIGWHVEATSSFVSKASRYDVRKLDDCNWKTAWVEGKGGDGIGEKIIFIFSQDKWPKEIQEPTISFWGFRIANGYIKNTQVWQEYSRVKKARILLNRKPEVDLIFKDSKDLQEVTFEPFQIKVNDKVSFELIEVYPGTKYRNTAITELVPLGAH